MGATETINVRLPEDLKRQGGRVLEQNGVSISQAVRKMFEYLEREQAVPDWMGDGGCASDATEARRAKLRSLAGVAAVKPDTDSRAVYREHLLQKHSAGVRR